MGTNLSSNSTSSVYSNLDVAHIKYGVDTNYFRGMAVNITSILKNHPGMTFLFHVLAFSITDDSRCWLTELGKRYDIYILHQDILSDLTQFPCFFQHSFGTFIRIFIPSLLQGIMNKVLYLDDNILCTKTLSELCSINRDNFISVVVHDAFDSTRKNKLLR